MALFLDSLCQCRICRAERAAILCSWSAKFDMDWNIIAPKYPGRSAIRRDLVPAPKADPSGPGEEE